MGSELELNAAATFLHPVLHRDQIFKARGRSIIACLETNIETHQADEFASRVLVIRQALVLLSGIHRALKQNADTVAELIQDLSRRRIVDGLLDLISLEGIYPCLSSAVGVPIERRVRSVFRNGVITRPSSSGNGSHSQSKNLLVEICVALDKISEDGNGLAGTLQERALVDLIAGFGELAYSPLVDKIPSRNIYACKFKSLLDRTPSPFLYPALTSLLHPTSPDWFRVPISTHLSLLPLRPQGVKQTINFIASNPLQEYSGLEASLPDRKTGTISPSLSLEIITRISKVLSSVPSSSTADMYFTQLAPQVLDLLDENDIDSQRVAAYIVGNGILGRRKYGAPGAIGWKLFAQPITEAIHPVSVSEISHKSLPSSGNKLTPVVVSEASLERSLSRLDLLVHLHPNPGLTKRLIDPCLLSLWNLLCYARESRKTSWTEKVHKLLGTYFTISVGNNKLLFLAENLLQDQTIQWTYGAGSFECIEVRIRTKNVHAMSDPTVLVEQIDLRVGEFMRILKFGIASNDYVAVLFARVLNNWLLRSDIDLTEERLLEKETAQRNPLYLLVQAKLAQELLKEYNDKLAASPERIIDILNQLLISYVRNHERENLLSKLSSKPCMATLENIVSNGVQQKPLSGADEMEIISMALSILSAILLSPEFSLDPETLSLLGDLHSNLIKFTSSSSLPAALVIAATNVLALLNHYTSLRPSSAGQKTPPRDPYASDRKEYDLALSYLTDALTPTRAQGLSILTSLIKKSSPVIDCRSMTILLQSLLQDEDEFIYLAAIKALGLLATRESTTVIQMLVEGYIDTDEKSSLDVRIRIGEALLKTIESLGTALVGESAKLIGEGMIIVAGRRAQKPKSASAQNQGEQNEESNRREAEEAWGGEIPTEETEKEHQSLTQILSGWQGHSSGVDDLRVRASALSILGTCIETSLLGLGSPLTSSAIDVGLSILTHELGLEAAILRRAAVLLLLSLARALDAAVEADRGLEPGFGFEKRTLEDVLDYLRRVGQLDADDLVRGHCEIAVEGLEVWMEKSMMRGVRELGKRWGGWSGGSTSIALGGGTGRSALEGLGMGGRNGISIRPRIEELG